MTYRYSLAGLSIRLECPFELNISEESRCFFLPEEGQTADLVLRFRCVPSLPPAPDSASYCNGRLFASDPEGEHIWFCISVSRDVFGYLFWPRGQADELFLDYTPGMEKYLSYSRVFYEFFDMETLLLRHRGLVLHSSLIRTEWGGLVFSAPPGTGKSTQARLWQEYMGAEVLNGDRAGLRRTDSGWMAYGLPFAGSSGIYRNECADLRGIITLGQAKENTLRPLRPAQAVTRLYPEILLHRWDKPSAEAGFDLLLTLVPCPP